jgi:xylan 1,4-beta-xylosidase
MRITLVLLLCLFNFAQAQTLVLPGDYPDPSVVKIGDSYWATATTSNWAPAYPLLESKDLVHWETRGAVFPTLPLWADYYFWAPEISYDNGKVYIYYAAHKRNGNLCLGVASADGPEGPYKDHGALICQEAGSIDGFAMRDENGKLFLIWKEDGNSIQKPTPIWAIEMNEDRTAVIGEKKELFRNDTPWEGNLVEGVSMIKHDDYYYAFYAGAACCGRECSYAMGVARSKKLLGPWEKYEKNPVFTENQTWKCPGHGTPVVKDGRYYLLYHAYHKAGDVYAGRQGVLKEFQFTDDAWIRLVDDKTMSDVSPPNITDDFNTKSLSQNWQWSVFSKPQFGLSDGKLELAAGTEGIGGFLGQRIYSDNYRAGVTVFGAKDIASGLGLVGDENNAVVLSLKGKKLFLTITKDGRDSVANEVNVKSSKVWLQMTVKNGREISFSHSVDGKNYKVLNERAADGYFLPPWDRAIRVALFAKSNSSGIATFDDFSLVNPSR